MSSLRAFLGCIALALSLACGGGGGGGGTTTTPPPTNAIATGFWIGTVTYSTGSSYSAGAMVSGSDLRVYSLADPAFISSMGSISISQNAITGNGLSYLKAGLVWTSTGSGITSASYSGTVTTQNSMTLTVQQTGFTATYSLGFASDFYNRTISLPIVAGFFNSAATANTFDLPCTFTISSNGTMTGTGAGGVSFTGSITQLGANNLFQVNLVFLYPGGTITYSGLGTFGETPGQPINSGFAMLLSAPGAIALNARMVK